MTENNLINPELAVQEDEIDLMELVTLLLAHIKSLIVCTLVGALIAGYYTQFFVTPQYRSYSMVYIMTKTTSITSLADLQIGSQLTSDFMVLAKSREVLERVIDQAGLNTTYEELLGTVSVENPADGRILTLNVRNPDPQLAADISNAWASVVCDRVAEVMNTDRPSSVQKAVPAANPASPNLPKNVALGGMVGLVLAAGVVIVKFLLNDSLVDEKDVEKYLQINVLAAFPLSGAITSKKSSGKSSKGKSKSKSSHSKHRSEDEDAAQLASAQRS